MKKGLKIALGIVFALIVISTFGYLFKQSRPSKMEFDTVQPGVRTIERRCVSTGKITPRNEVSIKPQISGIVSAIYKQPGDHVKAGDIIAVVQVVPDVAQLNSAESRVNLARIEMKQQEAEFNRQKQLYADKVISTSEYEASHTTYLRAKEELQNAIDALKIVKEGVASRSGSYSNTQIKSTITGTVLDVPVKVGNSVIQANTFNDGTEIAKVADMGDMLFEGKIDETEVGRMSQGMPVELKVGALTGLVFPAELEYISPKAKEENGTVMFEIKAAAHVPDTVLIRAGYSANADIILESRQDVLALPESTIQYENGETVVYVKKGTEWERRTVVTGLSDGLWIEIVSGVTADDVVRNGMKQQ